MPTPAPPPAIPPVPPGQTAQRLQWRFLPPGLRAEIERRCGAPVAEAESQTSGFTPGFASVLTCTDGSRHFVKAASVKAQRRFAEAYRTEIRRLRALPGTVPAPRLVWGIDDAEADWVALETEYVEGRHPTRPWTAADLNASLDACEQVAAALTPAPADWDTWVEDMSGLPAMWEQALASRPDLGEAGVEAAALAATYAEHTAGDTCVHTDLRDDNILLDRTGRAVFVDWNWPVRGAAWLDSLLLLIGPRGDGLDVEAVLRERELLRQVPAESIEVALALLAGYFFAQAAQPVPANSPHLREHQRWQGEVVWDWLCQRRGWR